MKYKKIISLVLISIFSIFGIFNSFASVTNEYILTKTDGEKVIKIGDTINNLIKEKGETYKNKYIIALIRLKIKYKDNQRISSIIQNVISYINNNHTEIVTNNNTNSTGITVNGNQITWSKIENSVQYTVEIEKLNEPKLHTFIPMGGDADLKANIPPAVGSGELIIRINGFKTYSYEQPSGSKEIKINYIAQ